ncbi:hypothetical protein BgiMline_026905, partial [Biomphalaria glabrata]
MNHVLSCLGHIGSSVMNKEQTPLAHRQFSPDVCPEIFSTYSVLVTPWPPMDWCRK